MSIVMLTEPLHYQRERDSSFFSSGGCSTLLPGACDAEYLRREIGEDLYERAIRLGVLVPVMDA